MRSRFSSLKSVNSWLKTLNWDSKDLREKVPILLVGGKIDLVEKRVIKQQDVDKIVKEQELSGHIECSSKSGENVDEIFEFLALAMLEKLADD